MIKCTNCNKVFDEEKYYGICPKCATYNRPKRNDNIDEMFGFENAYSDTDFTTKEYAEKDHDRMHKQYDGVSSKTLHKNPIPTYEQMKLDIDKKNSRRSKTKRTVTISGDSSQKSMMTVKLIAIIIFAVIMFISGMVCVIAKSVASKAEYTLSYETKQVECGKIFEYYGIPVSISHAEVIDTELIKEGLPDGMKMIAIHTKCHTEEYNWVSVYDSIYIKSNDSYRQIIDRYELEAALVILKIDPELVLTETGFLRQDGMFITFVDENADEVTLVLDEKEEVNQIEVLKNRYEVVLPLGE